MAEQIIPKRRHPSSGYALPESLRRYGVSLRDWERFTEQFIRADICDTPQLLTLAALGLVTQLPIIMTSAFALGAAPLTYFGLMGLLITPRRYLFKHVNLERYYKLGYLDDWINEWNKRYFWPKGLHVKFAMPKQQTPDASVVAKKKAFSDGYEKPMTTKRAARRGRLVVTYGVALPWAGEVPLEMSLIKKSRLHDFYDKQNARYNALIDRLGQKNGKSVYKDRR
ncbi:hypothetical protein LTR50_000671 [Elasticomyces elasticus]|nr:hypothetical protein LTR50_000671 [Elasticomyces elasticus]